MPWNVLFHDDFHAEFQAMGGALQDELLAHARLLQEFGSHLGRPTVDTLRLEAREYERVAFRLCRRGMAGGFCI